jgi:hypothetical protein
MLKFCKNENCPTSYDLLSFQKGELPRKSSRPVSEHLETCEFCAAEVEFYSTYPQSADDSSMPVAEIPGPLYQLAEALLKHRHRDSSSLNSLLNGKSNLAVESV